MNYSNSQRAGVILNFTAVLFGAYFLKASKFFMLSKYSFIQTFLLYLYRPIFMSFHFTISLCIYLNIQLLPPNANLKLLNPLHRKILFLYLMIFTITKLTLYYCASIIIPYTEYSYPFTYFFIFIYQILTSSL